MPIDMMNQRPVAPHLLGATMHGSSSSSGADDGQPDLDLMARLLALAIEFALRQQKNGQDDDGGLSGVGGGGGGGRAGQLPPDVQRLLDQVLSSVAQQTSGGQGDDDGGPSDMPMDTPPAMPAHNEAAMPAMPSPGSTPSAASAQPAGPAGTTQPAGPSSTTQPTGPASTAQPAAPVGPASATQPPNSVNVRDFGAKGDGSTDDQVALQNAVSAAKQSGQSVYLPPGTYAHSSTLTLDGVKMSGAGDKSVLKATDPNNSAIRLTGDGASLSNLKSEVLNADKRSSQPEAANVLVQNANNANVQNVDIVGAASNGVRMDNAHDSTASNCFISSSNADGATAVNGSSGNTFKNNVIHHAGDDALSDVSYLTDKAQNQGNTFQGNTVYDSKYGRGIAIMGGANAKVLDNTINGVPGQGIQVGQDVNSGTQMGTAEVSGNKVSNEFDANNGNATAATPHAVKDTMPDISALLGRDVTVKDRWQISPNYQPGEGPGAQNTIGNRG